MARKLIKPKDSKHEKVLVKARKYREDNREKRRKWNREWIKANRERYNASKYHYRDRCKVDAIFKYNKEMECVVCGFSDIRGLCLDHIDNDGASHRKKLRIPSRGSSSAGMQTYEALKREGWPKGLQVLCFNCNTIKEFERKGKRRKRNSFFNPNYISEYKNKLLNGSNNPL